MNITPPTWNLPYALPSSQTTLSPEAIARRRRMAEALMMGGSDYSPVQHWTQGAARLAQALAGNSVMGKADAADAKLRRETELNAATEKAKAEAEKRNTPEWKFTDEGIWNENPYMNPDGPLQVQAFQKKRSEWKKANDGTLYRDGENGPEFLPIPGGGTDGGVYRKKYDEQSAKKNADLSAKLDGAAIDAENQINQLDRMDQILEKGDIYQGTGSQTTLGARRLLSMVPGANQWEGVTTPDAIANSDEFASISNAMALMVRNPDAGLGMPGALSDKDREFLVSTVPGLGRSPGGNKQMIKAARRLNERKIEIAQLKARYVEQRGQLDDGFLAVVRQYAAQNPLFDDMKGMGGGAATATGGPKPGTIVDDFQFQGGDLNDRNNWVPVQ